MEVNVKIKQRSGTEAIGTQTQPPKLKREIINIITNSQNTKRTYVRSMLIPFKQKTSVVNVVQVYISKLNTEMIDILRQFYFPSTETAGRYRKNLRLPHKGICLSDG